MKKTLTPMRAIRKKCLDCSCNDVIEVKLCPVTNCALYSYRLGKRPETIIRRQQKKESIKNLSDSGDEE